MCMVVGFKCQLAIGDKQGASLRNCVYQVGLWWVLLAVLTAGEKTVLTNVGRTFW